ncbi:MAG: universal stress protein [Flavobacteriaceae bacterium]|nr:universal stress protein [Flavobacteriaceae bacterium]
MKNILVPIGNRKSGLNTLRYAVEFAKIFDATLYLAHVYLSTIISGSFVNLDDVLLKQTKELLTEYLDQLDTSAVKIQIVPMKGTDIKSSLELIINEHDIDLIISSAKTDDSGKEYFIGKITGSLIKDISTPVLIIPKTASFKPINKILMTLRSGSFKSISTLDPLATIQNRYSSIIHLLLVETPKFKPEDAELDETLKPMIKKQIIVPGMKPFTRGYWNTFMRKTLICYA